MPVFFTVAEAENYRAELLADCDAIKDVASNAKRDLTAEETKTLDQKLQAWKDSDADLDRAKDLEAAKRQSMLKQVSNNRQTMVHSEEPMGDMMATWKQGEQELLATGPVGQTVFTSAMFGSQERAARAANDVGHWCRAQFGRNKESIEYCESRGQSLALNQFEQGMDQIQGDGTPAQDALGGYLTPTVVASTVIAIRDRAGVIPRIADRYPMAGEKDNVPKETNDLLVHKPGETNPATKDDATFDHVQLSADDAYTLSYISAKLMRGNVVAVATRIVSKIGRAFAQQLDFEGINGDGTASATNFVTRVRGSYSITGIRATPAQGGVATAGRVTGSGAGWGGIVAGDINALVAALPDRYFADHNSGDGPDSGVMEGPVFVMSRGFYSSVIEPMLEVRGASKAELSSLSPRSLKGYPISFTGEFPTVDSGTAGDAVCAFGNFSAGMLLGDRQDVTIATSMENRFEYDQMTVRGKHSYDLKFHDPGTDTGTPAAGSVVLLTQG